jgi:hypothetical protein
MTLRRTLAAALTAAAIAAPAAAAQPAADMHASTAQAAAQAQQQRQDLRSPDARDAATNSRKPAVVVKHDMRSPDARDAATHPRKSAVVVNAPGATVVDSQSTGGAVAPGQPTWAVDPQPIAPAPAPVAAASSDDGVDWVTIGLGIAGTLLVLGGIVALTSRTRTTPRTRVSV